jgi:hypothetical protein
MTQQFIELTALYRSQGFDPHQPPDKQDKRLFNLAEVTLVFRDQRNGQACLTMRDGGLHFVAESYELVSQMLTAWQPRPVSV